MPPFIGAWRSSAWQKKSDMSLAGANSVARLREPEELGLRLLRDTRLLREAAAATGDSFRIHAIELWQYDGIAIVMGRHSASDELAEPLRHLLEDAPDTSEQPRSHEVRGFGQIAICRRPSGGCSVVLQKGVLCGSVVVKGPATWPAEWQPVHALLLEAVCSALKQMGRAVTVEPPGDVVLADYKAGGTARKHVRGAMLWHLVLQCKGEIDLIQRLLAHPPREPVYRRGRKHAEFVRPLDLDVLPVASAVQSALQDLF